MSDDYLEPTTQSSAEFAVVIPAFNAEATLLASIESAHNAGASEVIVVDDGSTDSTAALCRAHDIRVLTQPNAGAYLARRRGATLVTAPYIVFLDADDLLVAPGIHESLRILSAQADCAVVAGRVMASLPRGRSRLNNQSYSEINTRTLLTQGYGPFPPGAALVRRADYEAAIALDVPEIVERYADDYEMFIRLSVVGRVVQHNTVSLVYSMYAGKSISSPEKSLLCKESIRGHYARHLGIPVRLMSASAVAAAANARMGRASFAQGLYWRGCVKVAVAACYKVLARIGDSGLKQSTIVSGAGTSETRG